MTNVTDQYQARIAAGELRPDPAQEAVLPHFDRIAAGLRAEPAKRGFFRRAACDPFFRPGGDMIRHRLARFLRLDVSNSRPCSRNMSRSIVHGVHSPARATRTLLAARNSTKQ